MQSFAASMSSQTFVSLLAARAEREPDGLAFTYLGDGEHETARLTFGALDRRAREIGGALQARGLAGHRVLVLCPPGLEYIEAFFGCLYAGAIAVPAYPPDPMKLQRTVPRLDAIARDAACGAVLTTQMIHQLAQAVVDEAPRLKTLPWIAADQITDPASNWRVPAVDAESVAFLQYTSGSTAQPRGVVLTHANLVHNQLLIRQAFHTAGTGVSAVSWLPLYHDMGLIGTVLQPIFVGVPVCLMSPLAFLQRPLRWLQAITKRRASYSGAPSFAFELCVRKVTPAERRELDLSCWRVAFCGAEPVRAATIEAFSETFAACGFRREAFHPTYGLAEATLMATGGHARGGPKVRWFSVGSLNRGEVVPAPAGPGARALVGCGRRLEGTELAIVDGTTSTVAADDKVGEIWLRSPSVASGYFNRAAETAAVFGAKLEGAGDRPFLRTGDLGFLWEDELFFAGRVKDVLIIRGKNYYPQDLEATVEHACPGVFRPGCASAFSVEVEGEERIVIVQEVQRDADRGRLERATADATQAVFDEHGLGLHALVLIAAGELPKTSSGKVQRRATHEQYVAGRFESLLSPPARVATPSRAAPGASHASQITVQIERLRPLLARRVSGDASRIDIERPVSSYGLDSLSMVELHADLEAELGASIPIGLLLGGPSLRELAVALADAAPGPDRPATASGLVWSWPSRIDDELRPLLVGLLERVLAHDDTVGYPGPISRAEAEQVVDELDRDLAYQRCHLLICRLDGRVVGRCTLSPSGSPNTAHTGWISRAMVDPDLRTANLLPLACGHIVERCRALGLDVLCLDTRVGSRAAKLWQALGFREFGRLPDYSRIGAARYEGSYLQQRVDDLARAASAVIASTK